MSGVKHAHQTALPDDATSDVSSSEWNALHDVDDNTLPAAAMAATGANVVFGRASSGAGAGEEIALTAAGRALVDDADAAAQRTTLGLVIGTDVEAHDADLTAIAGLTPTNDDVLQRKAGAWANRTLAQLLTDLGLGALYQPLDSDLTAVAGLAPTNDDVLQRKAGAWANRTLAQLLTDLAALGTTFQPLDSDLTAVAAIAPANDDVIQRKAGAWANRTIAQLITDLGAGGIKLGYAYIPAGAMMPALTNGATGPTQIERPTNGQNLTVLDFPDAATRYGSFSIDMPTDYNGGTFTVEFEWTNANGNTQVARWQIEARAYTDAASAAAQTIDQAWGTAVAVDDANQSTAYQFLRSAATAAVTASGSPAAGCRMFCRVARLGSHANDTLASDARLMGVRIVYTRS